MTGLIQHLKVCKALYRLDPQNAAGSKVVCIVIVTVAIEETKVSEFK